MYQTLLGILCWIGWLGIGLALPLKQLHVPTGFQIHVYAANVPGARQLALGDNGIVYVGSRMGTVYALMPDKLLTRAKQIRRIARHLNLPNGVAYHQHRLYIAEQDRITVYDPTTQQFQLVSQAFPSRRWHGAKYLKFGPDNRLYISIGMPCNHCNYRKTEPKFGTILSMKPDGSDLKIYAKGIRNSVGFDWHPVTKTLWFTDNGRDWLGDDFPPDELNHAPTPHLDFWFPGPNRTPPAYALPAHVAPLGLTFYTGKTFPKRYHNQAFIAEHGSWNRSQKVGYQVVVATIENNRVTQVAPFITGWLQGQTAWGRPVDCLGLPDGSLLISDDKAGVVYRVSH